MAPRRSSRPRRGPGPLIWSLSLGLAALGGLAAGQWLDSGAPQAQAAATAALPNTEASTPSPSPSSWAPLERPLNVLLMATDVEFDYRQGHPVLGLRGRTDTMILARLDPGRGHIRLLSIPRDTRVTIAGREGHFKINAANPYGGPELAKATVSGFLGVSVDRYVVLNTRAVVQLVDALGGVELDVPKALDYDDHAGGLHIHLAAGPQHLDGRQAHDYLRFRHDDQGDIGRVQRQQAFLQACFQQLLTPTTWLRAPRLLQLAQANLGTDLSRAELFHLIAWGKDRRAADCALAMVPGREGVIGGGWYWVPDEEGTRRLVSDFLLDESAADGGAPSRSSAWAARRGP